MRRIDRQHLQHQLGHLVRRPGTESHAAGRTARVSRVARGVVEHEAHPDHRSCGQPYRFDVAILVLPREVPVVYPHQRPQCPIRQDRVSLHLPGQIVRVRIDGKQVDVGGQAVAVLHDMGGRPRGNVDGLGSELHHGRSRRRDRVREEEADRDPDGRRLSPRDQVGLEHEVGPRCETPCQVVRDVVRGRARSPAEEVPLREARLVDVAIVVAGTGIGGVQSTRRAGTVDQDAGVVDAAGGDRLQLDRLDEALARRGHPHDEVAVDVLALRRQQVGRIHGDDEIGRAAHPPGDPRRRLWQLVGVALGNPRRDPALDEIYLLLAEPPLAEEAPDAGRRLPRRHVSMPRDARDHPGAGAYICVCRQAERGDRVGAVARDAVPVQNRSDVSVVGNGLLRWLSRGSGARRDRQARRDRNDGTARRQRRSHGFHGADSRRRRFALFCHAMRVPAKVGRGPDAARGRPPCTRLTP